VSASSRLFKVSLPIIEGGCNRRTKKSYLSAAAAAAAAAAARKAQFRQKAKSVVRITFWIVFLSPYPELAGTNYILSGVCYCCCCYCVVVVVVAATLFLPPPSLSLSLFLVPSAKKASDQTPLLPPPPPSYFPDSAASLCSPLFPPLFLSLRGGKGNVYYIRDGAKRKMGKERRASERTDRDKRKEGRKEKGRRRRRDDACSLFPNLSLFLFFSLPFSLECRLQIHHGANTHIQH
jgi:hypothetical protein